MLNEMYKRSFLIIIVLTLILAACAPASSPAPVSREVAPGEPAFEAPSAEEADSSAGGVSPAGVAQNTSERIVIKNARLEIVVNDPDQAMDSIGRMAEQMGGFVVTANLYQSVLSNGVEVPRATITVRVPVERLDEAIGRIEEESDRKPLSKNIDSQDVTFEYTDLQSRLRNLEATEAQLVRIMEDANRTEDVLSVYSQLTQVREQIEVIQGQINYYERSADLSAISVELIANAAVQPITIGGWEPVGVAKDAITSLIQAMQALATAAIWLVLFPLPVLVVILLPLYLIVRLLLAWRTRRRRRMAPPPPAPSATD
jgi:hypothetical protein